MMCAYYTNDRLLCCLGEDGISLRSADFSLLKRGTLSAAVEVTEVTRYTASGIQSMLDKLLEEEACFSLKQLAIDGSDLLALGLQGRQVGSGLQLALAAVLDGKAPNEKQTLLELVKAGRAEPE
jgi:tRNA nucleotidyltransferase (CCA-adding enzyme)